MNECKVTHVEYNWVHQKLSVDFVPTEVTLN